jgi:GntR family transcriptional regulator/MocR family aminotransferase
LGGGVDVDPRVRREAVGVEGARPVQLPVADHAEFRYDRQPVGALQGLAPEHVAYVGTVSKTLAPALRLGWMVLPGTLAGPVTAAKHRHDSGRPVLDQLALAHLLDSGSYERHLRRMCQRYRQRRDRLLAALRHHLPAAQASDNRLVLGYGNITPAAIDTAIARLAQALATVST